MSIGPARRDLATRLESAHPAWSALILGLMAGAYRLWMAAHHGGDTFDGAMVKGMPYTDAWGWYMVSLEFSRGERWSSLWTADVWGPIRPFYYVFMGSIFTLTGASVGVVRCVHIVLGMLSAILIFDMVRRIAPVPVAFAAALAHAFSREDAMHSLGTMTETLGSFLTNVWLWTFVLGIRSLALVPADAPRRFSWRLTAPFLASGVALGLANLTRPLNLLAAVPFVALLPVVLFHVGVRLRRPLLLSSCVFLSGIILVVGPWILRQRMVYGITTLSFNSAEALFAATAPRFGTWTPEVTALTRGLSVADKAAFYDAGTRRHLRRHWRWYIGNVWTQLRNAAERFRLPRGIVVAACGVFLASSLIDRRPERRLGLTIALGATVAAIGLPDPYLCALWIAASVVALVSRHPMAFLAAALAATLGLLGALALPADRLTYSLEWLATALTVWLVSWSLGRSARSDAADPPWVERLRSLRPWGRVGQWASRLGSIVGVLFLAGLTVAAFRNVATSKPAPPILLPTEAAQAWKARMWPGLEAYEALRNEVALIQVRFIPDYRIPLRAGERLDHWSPVFQPRPYDFTLVAFRPSPGAAFVIYAGGLPQDVASRAGDVVLLVLPVVYADGEETFEVIATGIGGPAGSTARVAYPDPAIQRAHAEHLASLAAVAPVTPEATSGR